MLNKFLFYQRHGVEEYYLYDPFRLEFNGWLRGDVRTELLPIDDVNGFISPNLGIQFDFTPGQPLQIFLPDGEPFRTFTQLKEATVREQAARLQAEQGQLEAEQGRTEAEEKQREAEAKAERLAARLRESGIDPSAL